jgi:hypothetical protein
MHPMSVFHGFSPQAITTMCAPMSFAEQIEARLGRDVCQKYEELWRDYRRNALEYPELLDAVSRLFSGADEFVSGFRKVWPPEAAENFRTTRIPRIHERTVSSEYPEAEKGTSKRRRPVIVDYYDPQDTTSFRDENRTKRRRISPCS